MPGFFKVTFLAWGKKALDQTCHIPSQVFGEAEVEGQGFKPAWQQSKIPS
jgi:hypothetical protein